MTHKDDSAFARPYSYSDYSGPIIETHGLSKREYFAASVLQGMYANSNPNVVFGVDFAKRAVEAADELIKALNNQFDSTEKIK